MQKNAVIFANQKQDPESKDDASESQVVLSHKEYIGSVQEAYRRGAEAGIQAGIKKEQPEKDAQVSVQKQTAEVKQRFQNITARQDIELLRVKAVFPFDFFPDTLVIDTTKVTISNKQFFATEFVTTIPLKDISDVTLQTAFFMASLVTKYMPQASSPGMNQSVDVAISSLWREDAIRAKNILKGVMVAKAEQIDISKLSPKEVVTVIEQFGHSEGVV